MKLAGPFVPRFAAKTLGGAVTVDIALFGAGVTTAAASVVFAVAMFARAGDAPMVNGLQYLGVFGQPHGHGAVVAAVAPRPRRRAGAGRQVADAKTAAPARADSHQSSRHVADRLDCPQPATTRPRPPTPTVSSGSSRAWRGCATASRRG